tara:strand:- start:956 stop:1537 length:582 start_codon:yes stop_codon:yes gene_type:complete
MKLMIDLFSGLGGASEAMAQDDEWAVLRYENNAALGYVPFTTLCDLKNYEIKCRHDIEIIWASPPCQDFSNAYDAPRPRMRRNGLEFEADLSLVKRALEIIEELKPRYWIIENVVGAISDFEPILGAPRQIIGPFVLWGRFPLIPMSRDFKHSKAGVDKRHSPIRSNIRAQIPLEISEALLDALMNQRTLFDY